MLPRETNAAETSAATLKLIAAARWGSATQVQEALESENVNKNYKEKTGYGYTPLHRAVHSNPRVAWVLIQDPDVSVNEKTDLGQTPLHFAWRQCVDAMLLFGETLLWNEPDKIGQTPLLYHARIVNEAILRDLLRVDLVEMHKQTEDGFTVLHQVVERDSPFPDWYKKANHSPELRCKVVRLLLDELKRRVAEEEIKTGDELKRRVAEEENKTGDELKTRVAEEENKTGDELKTRVAEEENKTGDELKTRVAEEENKTGDELKRRVAEEENKTGDELKTRVAEEENKTGDELKTTVAEEENKTGDELKTTVAEEENKTETPAQQSAKNQQNESQQNGAQGSRDQETDLEIKKAHARERGLQSVVKRFVNKRDKIGRTALHYIAEEGCVEILDTLLNWLTDQGVLCLLDCNPLDKHGLAPLHLAVRKGHKKMVKRLLHKTQADANVTVGAPATDIKLMQWNEQHLELCRPKLSSKAPPEEPKLIGRTALDFAAMGGHTKIADLLLNWKQGEKSIDKGKLNSAFTYITNERHLEVATLLLKHITVDPKHKVFKKMLALAMNKETTDPLVLTVFEKSQQAQDLKNTFERLLIVAANENLPDVIRNILNWKPEVDVNFEAIWRDERNPSNLRATPLHFAVLRGHVDIVKQLLRQKSLDVNAEDSEHRTPLQIAVEGDLSRHADDGSPEGKIKLKQIEKLLMERAEVKDLVERSYRDREVIINAVNALLVGAALIATVTFAGWLTPPLGLTPYVAPEPYPASPATSPHYTSLPHPTSVKVFWVCNSLSFFLAIATVLVCAFAAMPILQHTYIREAVKSLRTSLSWASMFFLFSVFSVLGAFASAGFAVLPSPHLNYKLSMILTVAIGGFFCTCCLVVLMCKLSRQSYEYSCGYLRSMCQKLSSNQNRASGESHGEESSSKPPNGTPSPQQGTPPKMSEGPPDDSKVPLLQTQPPPAKSAAGSEDNSSRGGTKGVVDKDNKQPEKDDETIDKKIGEMWGKLVKKRHPNNADPEFNIRSTGEKMILNKNDIECIIGGTEPLTDNLVNVYLKHCIPDQVPSDTWIASQHLTTFLFSQRNLSYWIENEWTEDKNLGDYSAAHRTRYHVFPFLPKPEDGACGHWSLICWGPDGFVHFNSKSGTHKKKDVAPFFKKLEMDLSKLRKEPEWEKANCSQQDGSFECGYYMLLFLEYYITTKEITPPKFTIENVNGLKNKLREKIFRVMEEECN